jgi:NTP pyrophosphatase (non-canonical NTP hydrolase)
MTYYLYHIPGKKIGVTRNLEERVHKQQGYNEGEYQILAESKDITEISNLEIQMQQAFGYRLDRQLYKNLKCNNKMEINITEQTTTFPCPVNKLKGQLMDNIGMTWRTSDGDVTITTESVKWVMKNVKTSMYNDERSYVYNKAFVRYFDNNNPYTRDKVVTVTGGLSPTGPRSMDQYSPENKYAHQQPDACACGKFDLIREWADERGLYDKGDTKTQALKLVEEMGEICRAILKDDKEQIIDGIGDCVVVLTNLAELINVPIELCIDTAYDEIKNRSGKMVNGTFKKD